MKKFWLFALVICFVLSGCTIYNMSYDYEYSFRYVNTSDSTKKDTSNELKFSDDLIAGRVILTNNYFGFEITNNTNEIMKIDWNEASMFLHNLSRSVIHKGVNFEDTYQQVETIFPHAKIAELVVPAQYWNGWNFNMNFFATNDENNPTYKDIILGYKGEKISLYLPIQYQGKNYDYIFNYVVSDVRQIPKKVIKRTRDQDYE